MAGPKLMLFGYARHGKDTAAEMLRQHFGVSVCSSSWFSAEKIMMPYFNNILEPYPSVEACFEDRVNHRAEWFDEIARYNGTDLAVLAREIFAENDVYMGIRNDREFNQAKCEGLFDYAIWVDRSYHVPAEAESSNKMKPWMADYILDNNSTLAELEERVCKLYNRLRALKSKQVLFVNNPALGAAY